LLLLLATPTEAVETATAVAGCSTEVLGEVARLLLLVGGEFALDGIIFAEF
jgi:hypothetical protein